jgi:O-antigen ligase
MTTLSSVLYYTLVSKISFEDLQVVQRFTFSAEQQAGNEGEHRNFAFKSAWEQFLQNPVIGDRFVTTLDGFYPHNLYLEVLMATGIIGGFFFYGSLIIVLKKMLRLESEPSFLVLSFLLILQLFGQFTSGCIFTSPDFWALYSFFLIFPYKNVIDS